MAMMSVMKTLRHGKPVRTFVTYNCFRTKGADLPVKLVARETNYLSHTFQLAIFASDMGKESESGDYEICNTRPPEKMSAWIHNSHREPRAPAFSLVRSRVSMT